VRVIKTRKLIGRNKIHEIVINEFSQYIKIAESRRAKPFLKGKRKIPKKYQNENFEFDSKGRLINKNNGSVVPSNPMVCGKPRYWKINGQDIYNQKIKFTDRAKIVGLLHEYFGKHLVQLRDFKFPDKIGVRIIFYVLDEGKNNIDNDNKWIYEKVIQDTMTQLSIISDDNPYVINENCKKTEFVDKQEDVKLVIEFYE